MSVAIRNTKHEILKALIEILEAPECGKITTKTIAQKTDVTESALYKHYRNKLYTNFSVCLSTKVSYLYGLYVTSVAGLSVFTFSAS